MEANLTDLIGYSEAARMLGTKLSTLYAWVHQKRVPHVRFGRRAVRFDRGALEQWVAAHRIEGTAERAT